MMTSLSYPLFPTTRLPKTACMDRTHFRSHLDSYAFTMKKTKHRIITPYDFTAKNTHKLRTRMTNQNDGTIRSDQSIQHSVVGQKERKCEQKHMNNKKKYHRSLDSERLFPPFGAASAENRKKQQQKTTPNTTPLNKHQIENRRNRLTTSRLSSTLNWLFVFSQQENAFLYRRVSFSMVSFLI